MVTTSGKELRRRRLLMQRREQLLKERTQQIKISVDNLLQARYGDIIARNFRDNALRRTREINREVYRIMHNV